MEGAKITNELSSQTNERGFSLGQNCATRMLRIITAASSRSLETTKLNGYLLDLAPRDPERENITLHVIAGIVKTKKPAEEFSRIIKSNTGFNVKGLPEDFGVLPIGLCYSVDSCFSNRRALLTGSYGNFQDLVVGSDGRTYQTLTLYLFNAKGQALKLEQMYLAEDGFQTDEIRERLAKTNSGEEKYTSLTEGEMKRIEGILDRIENGEYYLGLYINDDSKIIKKDQKTGELSVLDPRYVDPEDKNPLHKPFLGHGLAYRVARLRESKQESVERRDQERGHIPWTYEVRGFYYTKRDEWVKREGATMSDERLTSVEEVWRSQLEKLCGIQEITSKRPVIFLDVGNGLGISMLRVAKSMEGLIREGKLVFVGTNFEFKLDLEFIEAMFQKAGDQKPNSVKNFILERLPLVNFLQSDSSHLWSAKINVAGKEYPLKQNVDLLHTCFSVTAYSEVPDVDFWVLGRILSPGGTLLIDAAFPNSSNEDVHTARTEGVKNLRRVLQVQHSRLPGYAVFNRPDAPEIQGEALNDEEERKINRWLFEDKSRHG